MTYPGTPLGPGLYGDHVKHLQRRLGIAVTGVYDEHTTDCVRCFQLGAGLVADGVADEETWAAVERSGGR